MSQPSGTGELRTEHGPWSSRALARLLTRVIKDRKLAYLVVSDGRSEKCLFYTHGGLRITCVGERQAIDIVGAIRRHPKFQAGWLPQGDVDPEHLERACAANFELERITHDAYKLVARHELFDLMVWDGAEYTFAPGDPPRQVFDRRLHAVRLSTGVNKVLEDVLARVDDWKDLKRELGSPAKVRFRRGPSSHGEPDRLTQSLFNTIKANGGDCRLERLLLTGRRASNLHALRVAEKVRDLMRQKQLERFEPVSGEGLTSRLRGELTSEIAGIEEALELMINRLQARRRLAQGYQALGDNGAAVENLRLVGEAYLERGDTEQAIGVFREVLGIVPEAFFAREQIARVYENLKKVPEAVGEWLELARSYARFGLLNRALQRMLNVVRLEPATVEHRRRLIDLREAIGDDQGAARDYAALGELYQAQGQLDLAGACLARSLQLDPSDVSYQERARALRPATGGAGKALAVVAWLLVVVAGVVAWGHRSARAAFVAARQGAVDAALEGDFPAAYKALGDYRALYGWQHVLARSALEDLIARRDLEGAEDERVVRMRVAEALPRWAATLRPDLERYAQQGQRARELVQQASEHAAHGRTSPLLATVRELAGDELAWTEAAQGFRLQIQLESLPPGAQVARDGVGLGSCPLAVEVGVEPLELLLTCAGSAPTALRLDLRDEALELEHEVRLPPEQLWAAAALGPIRQRPAVGRGRVAVCGDDQRVRLVGPRGEQWAVQLEPDEFPVRAPVLTRDAVLVATSTRLRALELEDGSERWSLRSPPGVHVLGAYADRVALARGRSLRLISAKTHEVLGEENLPGDVISGEVSGSYAVLSTGGPNLCAVALRTQELAKTVPVPRRVSSVPLFTEFGFVALDEDLRLRLVHTEERWAVTLPGPLAAPLAYTPGDIPLLWSATGSALACIKLESGRGRWSRDFEQPIVDFAVAARAFVATAGGEVWCLDLETGDPRWRYLASGPAKLVATRDVLYVVDAGGGIVALPVD